MGAVNATCSDEEHGAVLLGGLLFDDVSCGAEPEGPVEVALGRHRQVDEAPHQVQRVGGIQLVALTRVVESLEYQIAGLSTGLPELACERDALVLVSDPPDDAEQVERASALWERAALELGLEDGEACEGG